MTIIHNLLMASILPSFWHITVAANTYEKIVCVCMCVRMCVFVCACSNQIPKFWHKNDKLYSVTISVDQQLTKYAHCVNTII